MFFEWLSVLPLSPFFSLVKVFVLWVVPYLLFLIDSSINVWFLEIYHTCITWIKPSYSHSSLLAWSCMKVKINLNKTWLENDIVTEFSPRTPKEDSIYNETKLKNFFHYLPLTQYFTPMAAHSQCFPPIPIYILYNIYPIATGSK